MFKRTYTGNTIKILQNFFVFKDHPWEKMQEGKSGFYMEMVFHYRFKYNLISWGIIIVDFENKWPLKTGGL